MTINFKSRYIKQNELIRYYPKLCYFHFYSNYKYLYTKKIVYYNMGNKRIYLRISQRNLVQVNPLTDEHYICIISNKQLFDRQVTYLAAIVNEDIYGIYITTYIKDKVKEQLIINWYYSIHDLQKFKDINFYNYIMITSKELEQIKLQIYNIINSIKMISIL